MARKEGTMQAVLSYLKSNAGIPVHYLDIAAQYPQFEKSTIQSGLGRMVDNKAYSVYRIGKGVYVFRPNTSDPISAYPPEVTPQKAEKEWHKVEANKEYGKAKVYYDYVGKVGEFDVLRNRDTDEMYLAISIAFYIASKPE